MVVGGGEEEVLPAASIKVSWRWWLSEKELMAVVLCGNSNLMGSESKESPLDPLAIYEDRERNQVSKQAVDSAIKRGS